MLIFFSLLFLITAALGNDECYYLVEVKGDKVTELLNPSYPHEDSPFATCTWSVVADVDRRIVLECPFNDGSDTRSDRRRQCGAEMNVWDVYGDPTVYCRDLTFARLGNSNRMFINYTNDDGNYYNRDAGFKCYLYATMASLTKPYDLRLKQEYESEPFGRCDFFLKLSKYEIVRLATSKYTEDREKWRRCRWTVVSPEDSKISITCPYTEKPPDPVLIQAEPCTSQFTIWLLQYSQTHQCSDRAFADKSLKNTIVLEEMSIRRLPSRDFECYVHSESEEEEETPLQPSPYENCDHVIELNETHRKINIKSPNNPGLIEPRANCRWAVITPETTDVFVSCFGPRSSRRFQSSCQGKMELTYADGNTAPLCQEGNGVSIFDLFENIFNGMIITYQGPLDRTMEPFECAIQYDTRCTYCTVNPITIQEQKSYLMIKLNGREVREILSPYYPEKQPAGSSGRWTVVADTGRRVVLVCPFRHTVKRAYKAEDTQPCTGQFSVFPDNAEESHHCQDRGFTRIGVNHLMVLSYKNPMSESLDAFKCYVYAELKELWEPSENHPESEQLDFDKFDYEITLDGINMTTLIPPSAPEDEKKFWKSRWNITALYESDITIACHFTNKPPAPISIQVVPCFGQFTVMFREGTTKHQCSEGAFSHTDSGWMVLIYENLQQRTADNFVCVAYSSNSTISNEVTQKAYENDACDHVVKLNRNEITKLDSTHYDIKKDSGRSSCRWTFEAPENCHIILVCPLPPEKEVPKTLRCHGQFTVLTEGRPKTLECSDKAFSRTSVNNKMELIYENEFSESMEPFLCELYVVVNELETFLKMEPFVKEDCDHVVLLRKNELKELPYYPFEDPEVECRWIAVAELNRRIALTCVSDKIHDSAKEDTSVCYGKFTIVAEGGNETSHCHDRTFIRVGERNRMTITYNKTDNHPSDPDVSGFKCYLFSEVNEKINDTIGPVTGEINEECDHLITLEENELVRLDNPIHGKEKPVWSGCRWNVTSPPGTTVKLNCPFTDKPPDPVTMQVFPCAGVFSIEFGRTTQTHPCTEKAFSVNSTTNEMIISYVDPSSKRYEDYQCYVYYQFTLDDNPNIDATYANCDKFVKVGFKAQKALNSPNYPQKSEVDTACRWHINSPQNSQLVLNCTFPGVPNESDEPENRCPPGFTITMPGGNVVEHCGNLGFFEYSPKNSMIITYKTPTRSKHRVDAFQCFVYARKKKPDALNFQDCHHDVTVSEVGASEKLTVADPSTPCLWNVTFPPNKIIHVAPTNHQDAKADCKGDFVVYMSGKFKDGVKRCFSRAFWLVSDGDENGKWSKMLITYSPQEHQEPFDFTLAIFDKNCEMNLTLNLKSSEDFEEIQVPYFPTLVPPWDECTWHIIAPTKPSYRAIVECYNNLLERKEKHTCAYRYTVSLTGNLEKDGVQRCLRTPLVHNAYTNNITLSWELPKSANPYDLVGCRAYMTKRNPEEEQEFCNCGQSPIHTNAVRRIANGAPVNQNEFPMMAGLVNMKESNTLFCGGTIIARYYVLTAATCVTEAEIKTYEVGVIVDAFDLNQVNRSYTLYPADQLIPHEGYTESPHLNDIALVHVQQKIIFNDNVGPVCLPFHERPSSTYISPRDVFGLGWGELTDTNPYFLKKMAAHISVENACEFTNPDYDPSQHMCLVHERDQLCKDDTGGPILWIDETVNRIMVLGIIFIPGQCGRYYNTKVIELNPFLDWIVEKTPGVFYCKSTY